MSRVSGPLTCSLVKSPVVSPVNFTAGVKRLEQLVPNAEAEWIAGDTVGTSVPSRVANPASGASQSAYTLTTGDSDVLNAGAPAWWDFQEDTNFLLRLSSNTTFVNNLHKTTGGNNFAMGIIARPVAVAGHGLMGTQDNSGDSGFSMQHSQTGYYLQIQSNSDAGGGDLVESNTLVTPVSGEDYFFVASYDHATDTMLLWRNGELTERTHALSGTATGNGGLFHIGGQNAGAYLPANYRVYGAFLIYGTITSAQELAIRTMYERTLGLTLTDNTITSFSFTAAADVELDTLTTATAVQVSGFAGTKAISVSGAGSPQYRVLDIDNSTVLIDWTNSADVVSAQQYVQIRATSSSEYETNISPTLTVGTDDVSFSITTTTELAYTPMDSVVAGTVFDLDATIADSYPGSGTTLANLIASPADGSGQTAYDFEIVGTTPPVFNGSAGTSGAYFTLTNSGGAFEIPTNTAFLASLHKTTGGADFTFCFVGEVLDATWNNEAIGGTSVSNTENGVRMITTTAENLQLAHHNGTSQVTNTSTTSPKTTGFVFLAVAYDHTAGEVTYWLSSSTGDVNSFTFNTTTTDATHEFCLGAVNRTSFTLKNSQWTWKAASMWNKVLSDAEIADVITEYETRHEETYTT